VLLAFNAVLLWYVHSRRGENSTEQRVDIPYVLCKVLTIAHSINSQLVDFIKLLTQLTVRACWFHKSMVWTRSRFAFIDTSHTLSRMNPVGPILFLLSRLKVSVRHLLCQPQQGIQVYPYVTGEESRQPWRTQSKPKRSNNKMERAPSHWPMTIAALVPFGSSTFTPGHIYCTEIWFI